MAEKGKVMNIKDDLAIVRMIRTEACAKCRACIAGMKKEEMYVEAENLCDAKINDWVELELRENGFLKAVMIMYGIPFFCFMIGVLITNFLVVPGLNLGRGSGDTLTFLAGIGCVAIAFVWIKGKEHIWREKKYRPVAARITDPGDE